MHSHTRYIFFCENGPIAWSKKVMNVHPFQHRGESKYLTTCAIVKEIFWFYHLSPNDIQQVNVFTLHLKLLSFSGSFCHKII